MVLRAPREVRWPEAPLVGRERRRSHEDRSLVQRDPRLVIRDRPVVLPEWMMSLRERLLVSRERELLDADRPMLRPCAELGCAAPNVVSPVTPV